MRPRIVVILAVTLALTSIAIFSSAPMMPLAFAAGAQDKPPIQVRMQGKKFVPDHLTIKAGDTVEWVNEPDGRTHQVTTDPAQATDAGDVQSPKGAKLFDSRDIKAGASFRFQFTVPGVYRYACPPHELQGMVGQITVQP